MTETNLTNIVIALFVFIFILLSGTVIVTSGFNNYGITDNNSLETFNSSALQGNLTALGYEIEDEDAVSTVSDSEDGWIKGVGSVLSKIKAIGGIRLTLQNTLKAVLSFVPTQVWWLLSAVVGFILVMIGIAAWLRYKP